MGAGSSPRRGVKKTALGGDRIALGSRGGIKISGLGRGRKEKRGKIFLVFTKLKPNCHKKGKKTG